MINKKYIHSKTFRTVLSGLPKGIRLARNSTFISCILDVIFILIYKNINHIEIRRQLGEKQSFHFNKCRLLKPQQIFNCVPWWSNILDLAPKLWSMVLSKNSTFISYQSWKNIAVVVIIFIRFYIYNKVRDELHGKKEKRYRRDPLKTLSTVKSPPS